MNKLKPILTEKSLSLAKKGKYTFWVNTHLNKHQIRKLVSEVFEVTVKKVRTINVAGEKSRTLKGKKKVIRPKKKAIVTLAEKQKIDLFEAKE
jgi:large subunit ribosomal protein L23